MSTVHKKVREARTKKKKKKKKKKQWKPLPGSA
jgi:hypothetical protein